MKSQDSNPKLKFLLVVFGVVAGVAVAEMLLAIVGLPRFYQRHSGPPQFVFRKLPSEKVIYVNQPSAQIKFVYDGDPRGYFDLGNSVTHTTNSLGFRGPEFVPADAPDYFRIAFVGDSFTFGEGVKDADVFPAVTEQILNEAQWLPGRLITSLNFGVGGYNTPQQSDLVEYLVLDTKPDVIVIGYTLNDAEAALFVVDSDSQTIKRRNRELEVFEGLSELTPPNRTLYRLRFPKLVWKFLHSKKLQSDTVSYYKQLYSSDAENWANTQSALTRVRRLTKDNGVALLVVIFPLLFDLDKNYPFNEIHQELADFLNEHEIPSVDLLSALRGMKAGDLWVHPTDQHPNEYVHGVAAENIAQKIREVYEME